MSAILLLFGLSHAQELSLEMRGLSVVDGEMAFYLNTDSGFDTAVRPWKATLRGPGGTTLQRQGFLWGRPSTPQPGCDPVTSAELDCPPYEGPIWFEGMHLDLDQNDSRIDVVVDRPGKWKLTVKVEGMTVAPLEMTIDQWQWPLPDLSSDQLTPTIRRWYLKQLGYTTSTDYARVALNCWVDSEARDLCVRLSTEVPPRRLKQAKETYLNAGNPPEMVTIAGQRVLKKNSALTWYSDGRIVRVNWQGDRRPWETAAIRKLLEALPADQA